MAAIALLVTLCLAPPAHAQQPAVNHDTPHDLGRAPLRFRGELVYVSPTAMEVLENNRLVIGAYLRPSHPEHGAAELAQHAVGDEVELTARPIAGFYDSATRHSYRLEFDSIRYLGHPKASQLQAAMDCRARLEPGNLLATLPGAVASVPQAPPDALPQVARTAIRNWVNSFPNYLADVTEKYDEIQANFGAPSVRTSRLTYTATVTDGTIARSNMTLNNAAWTDSYQATPVYHWDGGFGYMDAFVRPECRLTIKAGARADATFTEPVDGFSFTGPANGCLGDLYIGYETVFAPVHGTLWIARGDHLPRRLEMTYEFPSAFVLHTMHVDIDWALVTVAKGRYVVPSTASNRMEQENVSRQSVVTYTNFHRFTTSTTIKLIGIP